MAGKFDSKKFKEDFDALDDGDKKSILDILGIKKDDDDDDVSFRKKVLERLDVLEKSSKEKPRKSNGSGGSVGSFFDKYFSLQ